MKESTPSHEPLLFFAFRKSQKNFFETMLPHCRYPVRIVFSKYVKGISFKAIKAFKKEMILPACAFAVDEFYAKTNIRIPHGLLHTIFKALAFLNYIRYASVLEKGASAMLVWNGGKFRQRIAIVIAKQKGIRVCYFENGLLPHTLVFDTKGINFDNSVPREKKFYENYVSDIALPNDLVPRIGKNREIFLGEKIPLPPVYIFVPFQVDYDTQIISQSPWIKNMRMLFDVIAQVAKTTSYHFVLKEHPSSGVEYPDLHERVRNIPNMGFYNTYATQELIEKSVGVITVNSTVGVESLLFGKTVITLGNAFYAIEEVSFHADDLADLTAYVADIENLKPNRQLVENFLKYLYHEYLIHKDGNEHNALCKRLENQKGWQ